MLQFRTTAPWPGGFYIGVGDSAHTAGLLPGLKFKDIYDRLAERLFVSNGTVQSVYVDFATIGHS